MQTFLTLMMTALSGVGASETISPEVTSLTATAVGGVLAAMQLWSYDKRRRADLLERRRNMRNGK